MASQESVPQIDMAKFAAFQESVLKDHKLGALIQEHTDGQSGISQEQMLANLKKLQLSREHQL